MPWLHRVIQRAMEGDASSNNNGHHLILEEWNDPLTPFGADPVFQVGKELYNPRLTGREGEFYNMTASSEDVGVTGWPRPFHPRPLEGRAAGFPVVVPTTSDRAGAAKMLGALQEGSFLDPLSRELNIDLVSYNHFANLLSYSSSVVVWDRAGQILLRNTLIRTLPVFSSQSLGDAMIIPLLLALLSVAYLLLSDLPSIVGSGVRRAAAAFSCCSRRWQRLPGDDISTATRRKFSAMEVAFDILVLGMLVAGLVLNLAASEHCMSLSPQTSYRVYDAPGTPAARYFLRAKQLGDVELQEGIEPDGDDRRWMEENDDSGLEAFGGLVHSIRMGSAQYLVSGVILALALVMAMLRSIHLWSFKIELGLVFEVMVKVVPDIAHLMFVMAFAMFGLAAAGNVLLGPELEEVSTPLKSLYFLFQVFLIGDMGALPTVVRDSREDRSAIMDAAAHVFLGVVPMLLCFVFFQFFVAIILEKFYSCKFELSSSGSETTDINDRRLVEAAEVFGLRCCIGKGGSIPRTSDLLRRLQQSSPPVADMITEFDVNAIQRMRSSFKHDEEGNQLLSTLKTNFGHEAEDISSKLIKKMNLWGGAGQASIMKMLQGTKKSPGASGYLSEVNQHLHLALKQVMILNAAIEEAAAMSEALFAKEIECKWLFKLVAANDMDAIPLSVQSEAKSFSYGLPGQPLALEDRRKSCPAKHASPSVPPAALDALLIESNSQPIMTSQAPLPKQGRRVTIGATQVWSIPVDGQPSKPRLGGVARPANNHKKRISSSAVPDRQYSTHTPFSRKSPDSHDMAVFDLDNGSQRGHQGPVRSTSSYSGPNGMIFLKLQQPSHSSQASDFRTLPKSPQERSFTAPCRSQSSSLDTLPLDLEVASSHRGHGEARSGAHPRTPNAYMPPRRHGSMI